MNTKKLLPVLFFALIFSCVFVTAEETGETAVTNYDSAWDVVLQKENIKDFIIAIGLIVIFFFVFNVYGLVGGMAGFYLLATLIISITVDLWYYFH